MLSILQTAQGLLCGRVGFFFQAEDGIRDLVRSRGLGDVDKRRALRQDPDIVLIGEMRDQETAEIGLRAALTGHLVPVSYTHLTLPTSDLV